MRYPIYFFLLLTGFFYLTGKPLEDKNVDTLAVNSQDKGQPLPYARRTGVKTTTNSASVNGFKQPENPAKTAKTAAKKVVQVPVVKTARLVAKTGNAKKTDSVEKAKIYTVPVAPAAKLEKPEIPALKWRVTSIEKAINSPPVAPTAIPTFSTQPKIGPRRTAKKSLDWTVFGNQRDRTNQAPKPRRLSQDEIDADSVPVDEILAKRARKLAAKKQAKARRYAKAKRRALRKARKARAARKKKSRRYARLKRKNKGAYRVARRAKKKSRKKKYASYKPRRKKFGFSTKGGVMSLGGF